MTKLTLHEYAASGNCYKIRLTAALTGKPLERREYDMMKGETRTPEFLANVNANGRIPVLQVDDRFLPESNAACYYLAEGTPLIPSDRFDHADMLRWLFWEQYSHEPNVATMRFWMVWFGEEGLTDFQRSMVPSRRAGGEAALKLMDDHLAKRDWFVGTAVSVADVALYAYTCKAHEAGFDMPAYPAVQAWLRRIEGLPGFVPFD